MHVSQREISKRPPVDPKSGFKSDNGLSPVWRQAIIWTKDGVLLIKPLGTDSSEILTEIQTFSFEKCTRKCRLENCGHFDLTSMC